jgi:hypothetical protein
MKHAPNRTHRLPSGELAVDQGREGHFLLSWNPDDGRFYVCLPHDPRALATFADRRHAVHYARQRTRREVLQRRSSHG